MGKQQKKTNNFSKIMFEEQLRKFREAQNNFNKDNQNWLEERAKIKQKLSEIDLDRQNRQPEFTFADISSKDSESDDSLEIPLKRGSLTSIDYLIQGYKHPKRATNQVRRDRQLIESHIESSVSEFSQFSINELKDHYASILNSSICVSTL